MAPLGGATGGARLRVPAISKSCADDRRKSGRHVKRASSSRISTHSGRCREFATDRRNRRAIRDDLDATVIVEAAAGTGKTTQLVARIVSLIETERATIGQIVAVTFSEKAAGELKLRIREQLEKRRFEHPGGSAAAARLSNAVHDFEDAHVSTIHGFCAELLRERPVEARVDPSFAVLTEMQADAIFNEAFIGWLHDQLPNPGEGLRRALRRPSRWRPDDDDENGPLERLKRAARDLVEWRDHTAPWQHPAYDRIRAIDALIGELKAFADDTGQRVETR